jgi:hypothetical protein
MLAELRERGRCLLVFGNAEEPADIARWLPGGSGHVLITSRDAGGRGLAVPVEVDVLARPGQVAILQPRVAGIGDAHADRLGDLRWRSHRPWGSWPRPACPPPGTWACCGPAPGSSWPKRHLTEAYPRSLPAAAQLIVAWLDREAPGRRGAVMCPAGRLQDPPPRVQPQPRPARAPWPASALQEGAAARPANPGGWAACAGHRADSSRARATTSAARLPVAAATQAGGPQDHRPRLPWFPRAGVADCKWGRPRSVAPFPHLRLLPAAPPSPCHDLPSRTHHQPSGDLGLSDLDRSSLIMIVKVPGAIWTVSLIMLMAGYGLMQETRTERLLPRPQAAA